MNMAKFIIIRSTACKALDIKMSIRVQTLTNSILLLGGSWISHCRVGMEYRHMLAWPLTKKRIERSINMSRHSDGSMLQIIKGRLIEQ